MSEVYDGDRPAWARRIVQERQARGMSQSKLADALQAHAAHPPHGQEAVRLPEKDSLIRRIKAWEKGTNRPDDLYAGLIARTFGTATQAFFPPDRDTPPNPPSDTIEIVSRLQRSDVDAATLDHLRLMIDQLCCQYPYTPAEDLADHGRDLLSRISQMLHSSRLSLMHHRETMVLAGWLCLLVGCCEYDSGMRAQAESTRQAALSLARESDNHDIAGWAHEMRAWFALTTGQYRGVIEASRHGVDIAGDRAVTVQLIAQEAKAWARVGDRRKVEVALDRGRTLLDEQPYPEDISHHFVVDPSKFDFYAMDCYRILKEDALAQNYAEQVLNAGTDFTGTEHSVMRNAEARVTLGVVAARNGDIGRAVEFGHRALDGDRRSLPSLLMVSHDLTSELSQQPDSTDVQGYFDRIRTIRAS